MKFLAAVLLLATLAQARPRYMMVPFDDEYETPQVSLTLLSYRVLNKECPPPSKKMTLKMIGAFN